MGNNVSSERHCEDDEGGRGNLVAYRGFVIASGMKWSAALPSIRFHSTRFPSTRFAALRQLRAQGNAQGNAQAPARFGFRVAIANR